MEKENKADLCSVLVKLGLAVMSVAYPQTGSQASLASAGVDVPSFPLNPDKADWSVWDFPDVVDHWNFPGYEGKKMTVSMVS